MATFIHYHPPRTVAQRPEVNPFILQLASSIPQFPTAFPLAYLANEGSLPDRIL